MFGTNLAKNKVSGLDARSKGLQISVFCEFILFKKIIYAHFSDKRTLYEIKENPTTYFRHTGYQNRSVVPYELKTDFGELFS